MCPLVWHPRGGGTTLVPQWSSKSNVTLSRVSSAKSAADVHRVARGRRKGDMLLSEMEKKHVSAAKIFSVKQSHSVFRMFCPGFLFCQKYFLFGDTTTTTITTGKTDGGKIFLDAKARKLCLSNKQKTTYVAQNWRSLDCVLSFVPFNVMYIFAVVFLQIFRLSGELFDGNFGLNMRVKEVYIWSRFFWLLLCSA